ncbi:unnamed protein product [Eruca vesicaria subsp. sativa]|uniref:Uncharacterized protein n=1 Tax=Eruca vesicaria subsp. sativa TaxID=29727 RepID=A0ABC8LYE8_ERUVS|nr:unnamed protein product [Eruca vesicaria subsp. sativa]
MELLVTPSWFLASTVIPKSKRNASSPKETISSNPFDESILKILKFHVSDIKGLSLLTIKTSPRIVTTTFFLLRTSWTCHGIRGNLTRPPIFAGFYASRSYANSGNLELTRKLENTEFIVGKTIELVIFEYHVSDT